MMVPVEKMDAMREKDRKMVIQATYPLFNFYFREDVYGYYSNRSDPEVWDRVLRPIPIWCVVLTLLLVFYVCFVIYETEKTSRLFYTYLISSLTSGFSAYLIVIIAWDLQRFFFCMFMSVFLISIFTLKKWKENTFSLSDKTRNMILEVISLPHACVITVITIIYLSLGNNRLVLFDNAVYLESFYDLVKHLYSRLVLSYEYTVNIY